MITDHNDEEHLMQCPECKQWFDMRDLNEVLAHEHWMQQKPVILYTHVRKKDKDGELYFKMKDHIRTVKLFPGKPCPYPNE